MPTIDQIATGISLDDGENILVTWNVKDDVEMAEGRMGGTTYTFHVVHDGKPATLSGGSRLINAIRGVGLPKKGEVKLRVNAFGKAGTVERTWEVSLE